MPIPLTRPLLPPLEAFLPYLERIWANGMLTNGGEMHQMLESALADYLGVANLALTSSGTLALITALRALDISGEVITTPYSFVATSHALLWGGMQPVFVDIDPVTLNMAPAAIEAAITPRTRAILAVHCYGTPCDTAAIADIAERHGLKVIYDAAHAFAVDDAGGSILRHGDMSILSLHATKVFNTFEGGAVICADAAGKSRIAHLRNFGFADEVSVPVVGINAKMSEVNAAFGLLQLQHIDQALMQRSHIAERYRRGLAFAKGIHCLDRSNAVRTNNAYFPILVGPDCAVGRDELYAIFRAKQVMVRRYFHPLISTFPMYSQLASAAPENLPVATAAAAQVLCLPIFPGLEDDQIDSIIDLIVRLTGPITSHATTRLGVTA